MKALDSILLWARISSTMMKGYAYPNGRLLPSNITIQPFRCLLVFVIWNVTAAECLIDHCPVCVSYIIGMIAWVSDDIQKFLKAGLGLLVPIIPIPIPKEQGSFIRVWIKWVAKPCNAFATIGEGTLVQGRRSHCFQ